MLPPTTQIASWSSRNAVDVLHGPVEQPEVGRIGQLAERVVEMVDDRRAVAGRRGDDADPRARPAAHGAGQAQPVVLERAAAGVDPETPRHRRP